VKIITSLKLSENQERNKEFLFAITNNAENKLVDEVHIITEDIGVIDYFSGKNIFVSKVDSRPTFRTLVDYANTLSGLIAITNSDIFFDDTLRVPQNPEEVYCLTRWLPDFDSNGKATSEPVYWHGTNGGSFDTYIFYTPLIVNNIDFYCGVLGCDGRFAYELHQAGKHLLNPSKIVRGYHCHASAIREYEMFWLKGKHLRVAITDSFRYDPAAASVYFEVE
jgi:hypothetical protein